MLIQSKWKTELFGSCRPHGCWAVGVRDRTVMHKGGTPPRKLRSKNTGGRPGCRSKIEELFRGARGEFLTCGNAARVMQA